MWRRLIFLICFVSVVVMVHGAVADTYPGPHMELKVDLCYRHPDFPGDQTKGDPASFKGTDPGFEDWLPWSPWKDPEPHDARTTKNFAGSGINLSLASGIGDSANKFVKVAEVPGKICNTFLLNKFEQGEPPGSPLRLVLWGEPELPPGEYWVYGYHNNTKLPSDPGHVDPCMLKIKAATFCADSNFTHNHPPYDDDCVGVVQFSVGEGYDVDVPIQNEVVDDNLSTSLVKFTGDGSAVEIEYWGQRGGSGHCAVLNAFIILAPKPVYAWGPEPRPGDVDVCPDVELSWKEGAYAAHHDVYFGTVYNDVNDATTAYDPNNVYEGRQPVADVNFDPTGLLEFGQTYYWRIDEVNEARAPFVWKGSVWSLTTEAGKAHEPSPVDGQWSVLADATLSWAPSCLAIGHDVYFGTDFNDVNDGTDPNAGAGRGRQTETTFDPLGLEDYTRYYWRIDEIGDGTFVKGDVWTFMSMGGTLFHFKFDGPLDANIHDPCDERLVTDSTGTVTFEIREQRRLLTYGEPNPLWNTTGTSANFQAGDDDEVGLYRGIMGRDAANARGIDATDLTGPQYTIEMWTRPDSFYDDFGLLGKWDRSYVVDIDDRILRFSQAGSEPITSDVNDPLIEDSWYHIAAVFDSTDPCEPQKLYMDGELVAGGGTSALNPADDDDPVTIGCVINPGEHDPEGKGYERTNNCFDGLIDELRVSDVALEPRQFLFRENFGLAWYPKPRDYARGVAQDVVLKWRPGDYVVWHDVYFGTGWDDVNDATTSSPEYQDRYDVNEHDPGGGLELDTTYYWRVDEVNDFNIASPWRGLVWRFTTIDYRLIDDMESYDKSGNWIYDTWDDGYANNSGSELDLGIGTGENPNPVRGGEKSMMYLYDNADPRGWGFDYYSEAAVDTADLPISSNWTSFGVKALTLYFYGEADNDANEQMYIGLEDTGGPDSYVEIKYGEYGPGEDMNDIKVEEWQEWRIALRDFPGVDANNIKKLYIGFGIRGNLNPGGTPGGNGIVYFDDIRLCQPGCVPKYGPEADLSGNCIVDLADVGIIAEAWLRTDMVFDEYTDPGTNGLVGWWKLDENDGNTANDSSVHANHGTITGEYSWVTGYDDVTSAVKFSNGKVLVPDADILRPETAVSASAWIYYSKGQGSNRRVVVKGANDKETYIMQVDDEDFSFSIRDVNGSMFGAGGDVWRDGWIHIAGTFDGDSNTISCYVNGQLAESSEDANLVAAGMTLCQDTNGLAIGNRSDANDRNFEGIVDDVRVYDRALSAAEVAWLASDGTGYVPLVSVANIYDEELQGEKAVNFRDLAKLMLSWGEEKLWPLE